MRKQHIISRVSTPLMPWKEAFSAEPIKLRNDVEDGISAGDVCWLDLHAFEQDVASRIFASLINLSAQVVVMSSQTSVDEAVGFFTRGARGYCHRESVASQLREISFALERRGFWLGSEAVSRLSAAAFDPMTPESHGSDLAEILGDLTGRERAVAKEIAQGASNREIAHSLSVSERTVKAHLSIIFEKMQVRDRVQLALRLNNVQFNRR